MTKAKLKPFRLDDNTLIYVQANIASSSLECSVKVAIECKLSSPQEKSAQASP